MKINVGHTDRWIRVVIGVGILVLGFSLKSWWGLIGLLPLMTAFVGNCCLYRLIGVNTCKVEKTEVPNAS
jgi:hypothetical protein